MLPLTPPRETYLGVSRLAVVGECRRGVPPLPFASRLQTADLSPTPAHLNRSGGPPGHSARGGKDRPPWSPLGCLQVRGLGLTLVVTRHLRRTALLHRFLRNLGPRRLVGAGDGVLKADPMCHTRSDQPFSRQTALGLCGGVRTGAHRAPHTFRRLRPRQPPLLHHFLRNLGSRRLVGAGNGVLMVDPMRHPRSDQPLSRSTALGLCVGVGTMAHRAPHTFRRLRPRQLPLLHHFLRNLGLLEAARRTRG
eukprot:SAG31_NODE_5008_length_2805_cov_65.548041_1_plen_250_part_00